MNEKTNEFETWEEAILDFFERKVQNIKAGQKCKLFSAREYIEKKEEEIETEKDEKKLQRAIKAKEKKQKEYEQLRKDAPSTEIRQWINDTSEKNIAIGKRIIKTSHVLKFTHSSSEPAGFLLKTKSNDLLLSTSSLKKDLTLDLAHRDGSLITVSRFLALFLKGEQIIDLILNGEFCFLEPFASDDSQFKYWQGEFKELVENREIRTADKAKQIYFPISNLNSKNSNQYHILVPLFSSSLANEIDSIVTTLKYGDDQKKLNNARKEQIPKFREGMSVEFPDLSVQQFGGEHPKNISMLNADRRGKSYLFSTQPPSWQRQLKPPLNKRSLFDHFYTSRANEEIKSLRWFLLLFERIDLSIKDPKKKKKIDGWVNQIIEEVMIYAISIQNLPAGWSNTENIRLKLAHQYFLDPYRDDEPFQKARQAADWQTVICADFANWLNGRLKGKDKQFTPQSNHTRMWKKLMGKQLREQAQAIDWDIKYQNREKQA
jgi:CRISPR-associated protein Csy1